MIRLYEPEDMDALMAIWLLGTINAHPFVNENYWINSQDVVKEDYLTNATTWVYVDNDSVTGFISIIEQQLIGALFVIPEYFGKGVAQQLIHHVQLYYPALFLEVYKENHRACCFYQKHGFKVIKEEFHEESGAIIQTMRWSSQ